MILLPRMTPDVPREFVAFVARHLETLRQDTRQVVDRDRDAESLCTDVLTDVAGRWRWLELLRLGLGWARLSDRCLRTAFTRRSQRWTAEQAEADDPVEVYGWRPRPPAQLGPLSAGGAAASPAGRSSTAARMASHLRPLPRGEAAPALEAAIAWLHAVKAQQRRRLIIVITVLLLCSVLLVRTREVLMMAAG